MGKYESLSDKEKDLLRRMGEAYKEADTTSWTLVVTGGGSNLLAISGGRSLEAVPLEKSFYRGLEGKGFLSTVKTSQNFLQITLQQPAIEYAEYAAKPGLVRWWESRMHDLAEDRKVWTRIVWYLLPFVLGLLTGYLLRGN